MAMGDDVERFRRIEALARSREQAKGWDYEGWLAARAEEKGKPMIEVDSRALELGYDELAQIYPEIHDAPEAAERRRRYGHGHGNAGGV